MRREIHAQYRAEHEQMGERGALERLFQALQGSLLPSSETLYQFFHRSLHCANHVLDLPVRQVIEDWQLNLVLEILFLCHRAFSIPVTQGTELGQQVNREIGAGYICGRFPLPDPYPLPARRNARRK